VVVQDGGSAKGRSDETRIRAVRGLGCLVYVLEGASVFCECVVGQ
jgi:hypothetical protein